MNDARHFALIVLLCSVVALVAVLSNRLAEKVRVPLPLLVLVGAAIAVKVVPSLHAPDPHLVEEILTIALIFILFDGGMHIGVRRFRTAAGPIALIGVVGTFLTAAGGAVLLHLAFGLSWYIALLVATAIAPTDPAVVFSVLGPREISGRSGTVLEGESGANDPVGIALMSSLIAAGALTAHAVGSVALSFVLQMGVGAAVGLCRRPVVAVVHAAGAAAGGGAVLAAHAGVRGHPVRGCNGRARFRVPRGVPGRHRDRRRGRAAQGGDRELPLGAGQPRRDRRVRRTRA